jgi:hypothetical protein
MWLEIRDLSTAEYLYFGNPVKEFFGTASPYQPHMNAELVLWREEKISETKNCFEITTRMKLKANNFSNWILLSLY